MRSKRLTSLGAWVFTLVAVVLTTVGLLYPLAAPLFATGADSGPDPVRITDYRADFQVSDSGRLDAVETITAEFPYGRHGIFRFFDLSDPSDSHVRLKPEDIEVRRDGQPDGTDLTWQDGRRFRVVRIGDPDSLVTPGSHTYTIRYHVDGALAPASAGSGRLGTGSWASDTPGAAFYWNVVPGGWVMEIDRVKVTVSLPGRTKDVLCAAGVAEPRPECRVQQTGSGGFAVTTGPLAPNTPVTVRAPVAGAEPAQQTLPWPILVDAVLGPSLILAVLLVLLALVGLGAGVWWARTAREDDPGFPVMYTPPEGLGPVLSYYLTRERVPDASLVATLLYLGERGLVRLTENGPGSWTVEGLTDRSAWDQVDAVTRWIGHELGVDTPGTRFDADGSVSSGKVLQSTSNGISAQARSWALESGLLTRAGHESTGRLLVVAATVLAAVLFFFDPFQMTVVGLPFAGFAIGGAGLLTTGVGTRRTNAGREVWSRAEGFHRLLSTSQAVERFDFSGRRELYTAFIPFAVAFGCAEQWARKYEAAMGEPAPSPDWYHGGTYGYVGGWTSGNHAFDSFESSLSSSISAYQATQSSSSGGGGGGGGGGSW